MTCSAANSVSIGEIVAVCPYTESELADRVVCSRQFSASICMDTGDIHSSQVGKRYGNDE